MPKLIYCIFFLLSFLIEAKTLNIKVSRYFDSEKGVWKNAKNILIKDDVIIAINTKNNQYDLDFSNGYIIPGLIDSHQHLFLTDKSLGKDFGNELIASYNQDSIKRIKVAEEKGADLLQHGIMAVRDLGNSDQNLSSHHFREIMPILISSGAGLAVLNAQFKKSTDKNLVKKEYDLVERTNDVEAIIKGHVEKGNSWIKLYADNDPEKGMMDRQLICQITSLAHRLKLKVAAHAMNNQSIENSIACNVDSIEHGWIISEENLQLMKEKNIFLVPTDISEEMFLRIKKITNISWPYQSYKKMIMSRLKMAKRLGVKMAFGSDFYLDHTQLDFSYGHAVLQTLISYKESGLSEKEILQMATFNAAQLLGEKKLGTIAIGSYANFFELKENPLADIKAIGSVNKIIYKGKLIRK